MSNTFTVVGENIHCTRIYKVGGKFCCEQPDGSYAINYVGVDGPTTLPVPESFIGGADWEAGKIKHCAAAITQGVYGADDDAKAAGIAYLQAAARKQEANGAHYLDINVDEFSTDVEERVKLMAWTVDVVQQAVAIPASIDSSNMAILEAGLAACDTSRGRPMVNSASLDRVEALDVARQYNAVLIVSAAGEEGLPNEVDERMVNITRIVDMAIEKGFVKGDLFIDPLVFPIATDGLNGKRFLDTVKAIRDAYGDEINVAAGLSNVSFGMPNRKLINQVFSRLSRDVGANGGIVDPMQINGEILDALDTESKGFQLARDLLLGNDDFGMNYISASRDGEI